jgi:hypothetical protein
MPVPPAGTLPPPPEEAVVLFVVVETYENAEVVEKRQSIRYEFPVATVT